MVDPAVELIEQGDVRYVCFDLLAELAVALLTRAKGRDPSKGFVPDVEPILRQALLPTRSREVGLITNGGGAHPEAATVAAASVACELQAPETRISTILGDDLTDRIAEIRASGWRFTHLESGEDDIDRIADRIVAVSAYTGSEGVIEALDDDADVVIGGRLADSALYCGPLMRHFGWSFDGADEDPDRLRGRLDRRGPGPAAVAPTRWRRPSSASDSCGNGSATSASSPRRCGSTGWGVHDLAFVRSGDKGNVSNVVVLARDADCYAALDRDLEPDRITTFLSGLVTGAVRVHRLPRLQAFNVVLQGALGGGATSTLRFDETGKSMCAILSRMPVRDDAG